MESKHCNFPRRSIFLLDTSFTSPYTENGNDITEVLYKGIGGLNALSEKELEIRVSQLSTLEAFLTYNKLVMLSEGERELQEGIRILNQQLTYLQRMKNMKQRKRKKICKREYLFEEETENVLELLKLHNKKIYEIYRKLHKTDPRDRFDEKQRKIYEIFLVISESQQEQKEAEIKLKHPLLLGESLHTDVKLVATAYTLAYRNPITILTRDKGIELMTKQVAELIKPYETRREYLLHKTPRKQITIYDTVFITDIFPKKGKERISFTLDFVFATSQKLLQHQLPFSYSA